MITQEKNRLSVVKCLRVRRDIQETIDFLEKSANLKAKWELLVMMPVTDKVTSWTPFAGLPELGNLLGKQISALARGSHLTMTVER